MTDPLTAWDDPEGVGRALADCTLANAIDDLQDCSRDECNDHADLNDAPDSLDFARMLQAYRDRAAVLISRLDLDRLFEEG